MPEATDTITIRVPISLKEKLEDTSKQNQLTLNLFINQILTQKFHWDEHVSKMGWLQFDPCVVRDIFDFLDDEEISKLAKSTKPETIRVIKFIYGDASLSNIIDFIKSWLNNAHISYRYTEDPNSHKFLVNHTLGVNWSKFCIKVSEEFLQELGYPIHDLNAEKNSYGFTIMK